MSSLSRRDAMGVTAAAVAALSLKALAEPKKTDAPPPKEATPSQARRAVTDAAERCASAGRDCLHHCVTLLSAGDKSLAECTATIRQMIPACDALGELARQASAHLAEFAAVCARICRDCETVCQKHAAHHLECKACMDACHACAAECDKVHA